MSSEIGSIQPNPYLFNIENRWKNKVRLAHEVGAGARCLKCEDKCPGFQLHFWRNVCLCCRCGKDDHEIQDVDEDIGKIVIGKLFERPIRTKEEEKAYSYGADLEMINDRTGKNEKLKFDWIPPGVEATIAKRYMELLPPNKRPVAGSQAAKDRRKQLEQQLPLYDVDEKERFETLPPSEMQNFLKYLDNLRTRVAGQGTVQEISAPLVKHFGTSMNPTYDSFQPPDRNLNETVSPNIFSSMGSDPYIFQDVETALNQKNGVKKGYVPSQSNAMSSATAYLNPLHNQVEKNVIDELNPSIAALKLHSTAPSMCEPLTKDVSSVLHVVGQQNDSSTLPKVDDDTNNRGLKCVKESRASVMQLTLPKPFIANSEQQRIRKEQFSTNLTEALKSPSKLSQNQRSPSSALLQDNSDANEIPYPAQAPCEVKLDKLISPCVQNAHGSDVTVVLPRECERIGESGFPGSEDRLQCEQNFHCQYCENSLKPGDVAVICERAGPGKYWHPKCFVCVTCKELLADLIYFYKDGQVFCGRHYTQAADIPRCKACDELIFGDSWTRADGCDWHIHHFCCFICDQPLAGLKYIPDQRDFPHCLPCHMSFKAKMCETCETKIGPEQTRAGYNGYFYHALPECFSCFHCKTSLIGNKFKMMKNWLFCSQQCVSSSGQLIQDNPNPLKKIN